MKKWGWPWARGAPQNFGVASIISATAGVSDFKFGTQLGFAKAHHKITPVGKSGVGLGLGKLPNISGFCIIFLQRLGLETENLVHSLGLPKAHHKTTPREKVDVALG